MSAIYHNGHYYAGATDLGETSTTAYRGDRGKIAYDHSQKTSGNPHNVTKTDVGLGNVPNVATNDQTPTYTTASTVTALSSGEKLSVAFGKIAKAISSLISHLSDTTAHITATERTTWNAKTSNTGTVTSVATGAGLTGGTITGSGTIKADLKSETKSTLEAASKGSTTSREYAVGLDKNGDMSVNVPWVNTTYDAMSQTEANTGTATTARSITAAVLKGAFGTFYGDKCFVLSNQSLSFSTVNGAIVATISNSKVTANSSVYVMFTDATLQAAADAGVVVDSLAGQIKFTAETTPNMTLVCNIIVKNP